MCVIVVQKGKFPGWDQLKRCWMINPHGAGYMYQNDDKVIISKGYSDFEEFKRSVESLKDYKKMNIVYHFRIATHGKIIPENTHPFPLSSSVRNMKALDLTCQCAIAHNGIITPKMYNEIERYHQNIPDSAQYIREISAMANNDGHISRKKIESYLEIESKLSHSRFAMMDKNSIKMFGTFYEYNGCWYSNNHSFSSYYYKGGLVNA